MKKYSKKFVESVKGDYDKDNYHKYRYSLVIKTKGHSIYAKGILIVLMMNPSHADNIYCDDTVEFVIKHFHKKYKKIIVLNICPVVNPTSTDISNLLEKDKRSLKWSKNIYKIFCLKKELKCYYDLLVATGDVNPINKDMYRIIMDILYNPYSYNTNKTFAININKSGYAVHMHYVLKNLYKKDKNNKYVYLSNSNGKHLNNVNINGKSNWTFF